MALLTPPDPTEEVAQPALRPRSPTAEDPHPMIYTTGRGPTPSRLEVPAHRAGADGDDNGSLLKWSGTSSGVIIGSLFPGRDRPR